MRRLTALLFLCLLAACEDQGDKAAFIDSRIPPALSPRFFPPEGWAWGLIAADEAAPVQRYGVSAPAGVPSRGEVLILPDYGESAEVWFETARDLNRAGFTVWVLERLGQGGSARYNSRRDLGHAPSLEPDVAATRAMIETIIRSPHGLTVLGHGEGGLVGLRAVGAGATVAQIVLSEPDWSVAKEPKTSSLLRLIGLGGIRATDKVELRQGNITSLGDPARLSLQKAWQAANPDLRMSGMSLDRQEALRRLKVSTRASDVEVPVLVLSETAASGFYDCAPPSCFWKVMKGRAFHLEADILRQAWLHDIITVLERASLEGQA